MTPHGSHILARDRPGASRRPPSIAAGLLWSTAGFLLSSGLALAFAFECGLTTILSLCLLATAFGGNTGVGPAQALGMVAALGLTVAALYGTVRLILALSSPADGKSTSTTGVPPASSPPGPLWDRDLDGGYWLWNRG